MKPVKEIKQITQPTPDSCVSTCLAMLFGLDVQDVIDEFHDDYHAHNTDVYEWLDAREINYTYQCSADRLEWGYVYLVATPSLNLQAQLHQIIIDMRGDVIKIYDPNHGKDGRKYYVWKVTNKQTLEENEVNLGGFVLDYKFGDGE